MLESWYMNAGIFFALLSFFGVSHSTLSKRLDKLSIDMLARKTDADIRVLINDKIEPFRIELKNLYKQLDIISHQNQELDKKIDAILSSLGK